MTTLERPTLQPQDLTDAKRYALKAICHKPAFRVRDGFRSQGYPKRITLDIANYLLDLQLVIKRRADNGTPYLTATERGRALVGAAPVNMPAPRRRLFHEPAETPILDADGFDDPFLGV